MTEHMPNERLIEVKGLSKRFGNKIIFSDINFRVRRGSNLGIMGPSGTGKSVFLKCILGLTNYDGTVFYRDKILSTSNRQSFFKNFGMLFQGSALFDSLNVWQNVAFKLLNSSGQYKKYYIYEKSVNVLERVGLGEHVANMMPSELSGGMQKRVALARAIILKPSILFFDEPTTGLDPVTSRSINQLIQSIVSGSEITSIVISHDPHSVRQICNDVIFINQQKIEWHGKVAEMENTDNYLLKEYLKQGS